MNSVGSSTNTNPGARWSGASMVREYSLRLEPLSAKMIFQFLATKAAGTSSVSDTTKTPANRDKPEDNGVIE